MPTGKRPTIITVAKAAGVTDGTVSRALRGDPRVRAETRAKVLAVAAKLGYRPDLAARALKRGASGLIGVFCDSGPWMLHNAYFGRLLSGLDAAAEEDGRRLMLYLPQVKMRNSNPIHDQIELGGLADLADGRVDAGVVVGGRLPTERDLQVLRQSGVPLVWLSPNEAVPGFSQLLSGARESALLAGKALASHGHRKVAFFGLFTDSTFQKVSVAGLQQGLGARAEVHALGMEHGDITDPDLVSAALDLALERGPSALVVASVEQALVVQDLLQQRGLRTPQDLSLLSFGPRPWAARARQPLMSLLMTDLEQGGANAYRLVQEGLAGKPVRNMTLEWEPKPVGSTLGEPR